MLIRFSVENFLSFNEKMELSMIAGRGSSLGHHVERGDRPGIDIPYLKSAVIYGANASGKSNVVKAMRFAQHFIQKGLRKGQVIPRNPFKLAGNSSERPSRFEFEFAVHGSYFAYGFVIDQVRVLEEWLYEIDRKKEQAVFKRTTILDKVEVSLPGLANGNKESSQRLAFMAMDTLPNELFLTAVNKRNLEGLENIDAITAAYDWVVNRLHILFPESFLKGIEVEIENDFEFASAFDKLLAYFNTGIQGIEAQSVDFESPSIRLPDEVKEAIKQKLEPGEAAIVSSENGICYTVRRDEQGEISAVKLMTKHQVKGQEESVLFEMSEESDGTQRIIDLIPMLVEMQRDEEVYVIDELDRSLHPALSRKLLELFHNPTAPAKGQLIVTTHESSLLDLNLLRKDEIWFVEKNSSGESNLFSLEEFKPRNDKEIRRSYMQGRYGAIPLFRSVDNFPEILEAEKARNERAESIYQAKWQEKCSFGHHRYGRS